MKTLYVTRGERYWQCPVTVKTRRNVIRWVGEIRCRPAALASLPPRARQQVAIMRGTRSSDAETAKLSKEVE
ncbi:hypothetical protein HA45_22645 [Pantoea rodasii]|nr:hypothetical protein HA45_22645 [Pantoea rodasii]